MDPNLCELYQLACSARDHAYAPYSGHRVGAAIRLDDGSTFSGCNVENASYGATICAERAAVQCAIVARGTIRITDVMVVTNDSPPWPPCGLCRQVLAEFGPACAIHAANLTGETWSASLADLYPQPVARRLLEP